MPPDTPSSPPGDDARDVRAVAVAIAVRPAWPPVKSTLATTRLAAAPGGLRDAGVDHRDADAAAGEAAAARATPAHTWSAPVASRRDRHHPRCTGTSPDRCVDVRVLAERVELAAGHLEHRAACAALLDRRAVARRERLAPSRRVPVTMTLGASASAFAEPLGEIARQPRALGPGLRRAGDDQQERRHAMTSGRRGARHARDQDWIMSNTMGKLVVMREERRSLRHGDVPSSAAS